MPIVYLDRDLAKVFDDTYGVTITTVVAKPKSRGYVEAPLRPTRTTCRWSRRTCCKHPDDMTTMIAGQRFFRDVLLTGPLGKRVEKVIAPAGPDLSDEVMAEHCRRFVKTNYHPASTARMGADGDRDGGARRAHAGARHRQPPRRRHVGRARTSTPATPTAPAMMLGDRCADFILGLDQPRASQAATLQGANA